MSAPDRDEVTVRRVGILLLLVAVSLLAASVAALVVAGRDASSPPATIAVERLGPRDGEPVADYLDAARFSAEVAEGVRVGLVSFASYLGEDDARALLDDHDLESSDLFVAVAGSAPQRTRDPGAAVAGLVRDAEEQMVELERLLPTVDDEEFAAFYRAELARYRSIRNRASGPVVFAAVITGRAADMRALASRGEVRVVEVGLGPDLAADAIVQGLRPEERVEAGTPEFRPT